jgi:hypothetical protein
MNRTEFERLRDLPGKTITVDIEFSEKRESSPNLTFEQVPIKNALGLDIILNGTFKPHIPSVTFNFHQKGVGPICRLDVNGTAHGLAGRTHKHDLQDESDQKPSKNLPYAIPRTDLANYSVRQLWDMLCQDANITHDGVFKSPDEGDQLCP